MLNNLYESIVNNTYNAMYFSIHLDCLFSPYSP